MLSAFQLKSAYGSLLFRLLCRVKTQPAGLVYSSTPYSAEHKQAIIEALKESHKDEEIFHREEIQRLVKRAEALKNRLSKIYIDKLDGIIDNDFWAEKNNEWTLEHAKILQEINAHEKANINYMQQGVKFLELLENLYSQYIQLKTEEKSKMLQFIFSNFSIDGQNVRYDYNRPFDIFAEGLSCTIKWAR